MACNSEDETLYISKGTPKYKGDRFFNFTPHLDNEKENYAKIRNITRKNNPFTKSKRSIDMNILADEQSIWNLEIVHCERCHSAHVYKFAINKQKGRINIH